MSLTGSVDALNPPYQNAMECAVNKELLPTPEELRKLLRYDPDTGKLFWLSRSLCFFSEGRYQVGSMNSWNTKHAGKEAFKTKIDGYLSGKIFGSVYLAHRVIWAMESGAWPIDQIDHEDHDRSNNIFENLRETTHTENHKNRTLQSNNTSGKTGVSSCSYNNKWFARIKIDGVYKHLGTFNKKSDAVAARDLAEIKYGFHVNHGVRVL